MGSCGMNMRDARRIDIISDTHGHISAQLRAALEGADLIIHAGDITSESDYFELAATAPLKAVLGNNDYFYDYGRDVVRAARFEYEGLTFAVTHYRERLNLAGVDVGICGHTHRPSIMRDRGCVIVNPGSPTYPRSERGATMARMFVADGQIVSAQIIEL